VFLQIEIKYYFIRHHVQKGTIVLQFVSDEQLANILIKPLWRNILNI